MTYGYILSGDARWAIYDALHDSKYALESQLSGFLRRVEDGQDVSSYAVRNAAKRVVTAYRALYAIDLGDDKTPWPEFTEAEKKYDGSYISKLKLAGIAR